MCMKLRNPSFNSDIDVETKSSSDSLIVLFSNLSSETPLGLNLVPLEIAKHALLLIVLIH